MYSAVDVVNRVRPQYENGSINGSRRANSDAASCDAAKTASEIPFPTGRVYGVGGRGSVAGARRRGVATFVNSPRGGQSLPSAKLIFTRR